MDECAVEGKVEGTRAAGAYPHTFSCSPYTLSSSAMGNDGGSIPDRRDLVKAKPKAEQADRANQARARWFFCALSKAPLAEPVASCALGRLYNKDAVLEFLLDRAAYGDGEDIAGHVRRVKVRPPAPDRAGADAAQDITTLTLTPNPAPAPDVDGETAPRWVCPLTFKALNGGVPFVYLAPCGCVFSRAGLLAVAFPSAKPADATVTEAKEGKDDEKRLCPSCGAKFAHADVRALNPPPEEEARLRLELAAAAAAKPPKVKKRKAGADAPAPADEPPAPKKPKAEVAGASRALAAGLAMEDARRKTGMSDAVKSLYAKDAGRTQTWATMGTFTRVRALPCFIGVVCADGGCSMREADGRGVAGGSRGYVCIMEWETIATNARSEQTWAGLVLTWSWPVSARVPNARSALDSENGKRRWSRAHTSRD
jgi:hypothetical protein